jgi:outer membrane protein assembly factor BamB/ElaB/YqjD/DUF883 family membrane-anchored ribosome-binding protein
MTISVTSMKRVTARPGSARAAARRRSPFTAAMLALLLALPLVAPEGAGGPAGVSAQVNPVYVDDSPLAREMFAQALDHVEDNIGEAARLLQELLDEYPSKLISAGERTTDRYVTIRARVSEVLRETPELLERYRQHETPRARRMLARGEYRELAMSRPLTAPGLEAMLILSQQHLEYGRFIAARRWLTEVIAHPELDESRAAHAWYMMGLIGVYRGDRLQVADAVDELGAIGRAGQQLLEHLERDRASLRPRLARIGLNAFDQTSAVGLDELIAEEIWRLPLEDSLAQRRERDTAPDRPMMGRALRVNIEEGHFLTIAPTVRDSAVFINQGHRVSAIDRMAGTSIWDRDYVDRQSVAVLDRDDSQPRDLNVVAVDGDWLVTLMGHAYSTDRSSEGRLVCLRASTGELRWSASLRSLALADDELTELFPHSAPVIVDGQVLVLARRVSRQSLTSVYLVSYDLETGQSRWIQHIVSSGSTRRSARGFSTIEVAREGGGDVFIASPVGAVARVDAVTGHLHWLHRFPVPINPAQIESSQRGWELVEPVVLADRVIAIQPGFNRIVSIDRMSGVVLEAVEARSRDGWNSPHYIVAGGRHIISVGRDIRAFDPDDLHVPVWRLPMPPEARQSRLDERGRPVQHAPGQELWDAPIEPYGRVQVVLDSTHAPAGGRDVIEQPNVPAMLLVPHREGLLVVDEESGHVMLHLPLPSPGNVLAVDAQLLVAGNGVLNSYMSFDRAEELMRRRVAENPADPVPALGLTRLGVRVGRFGLIMEAADLTQRAVRRTLEVSETTDGPARPGGQYAREAEQHRDELVSLLLAVDLDEVAPHAEQAERFFGLLDEVVRTNEQRLASVLKLGDWQSSHDPGRAIETYQRVLADRDLRDLRWTGGLGSRELRRPGDEAATDIIRPASAVARQRMVALLTQHGRQLYAAHADFAALRLRMLLDEGADGAGGAGGAGGTVGPEPLLELSRQFPLAPAAIDAAIEAADRLSQRGRIDQALDALVEGYRLFADGVDDPPPPAFAAIGRYVAIARRSARHDEAIDMLRYVLSRFGNVRIDHWPSAIGNRPSGVDRRPSNVRAGGEFQIPNAEPTTEHVATLLTQLHAPGNRSHPRIGRVTVEHGMIDGRLVPMYPYGFATGDSDMDEHGRMRFERHVGGGGGNVGGMGGARGAVNQRDAAAPQSQFIDQRWPQTNRFNHRPYATPTPLPPNDAVLVVSGKTLHLVQPTFADHRRSEDEHRPPPAERPKPLWSAVLPAKPQQLSVLAWTHEQLLVLFEPAGEAGADSGLRVISLSPADGSRQWITPSVNELGRSPAPRDDDDRAESLQLGERVVVPAHAVRRRPATAPTVEPIIPLVLRHHLILVRPDGLAAAFELRANEGDRSTRDPVWVVEGALDRIQYAAAHDGLLMLSGFHATSTRWGGSRSVRPAVASFDVRTGQRRLEPMTPPFAGSEIAWMQPLPLGMMIYASEDGITKIDMRSGEMQWINRSHAAGHTGRSWRVGHDLVVEDRRGALRRIDAITGIATEPFQSPEHAGTWSVNEQIGSTLFSRAIELREDGDDIIARFISRLLRFDSQGTLIGADMIPSGLIVGHEERVDHWLLRGEATNGRRNGERFVLVSEILGEDQQPVRLRTDDAARRYRVHLLSRDGRLLHDPVDVPVPALLGRVEYAALIDGWLLLSAGEWTITIPMPGG